MFSIILIQPEHASNVGAVARAMANFGVNKLFVVQPICDVRGNDAIQYAKHAREILKKAVVVHSLADVKAHTLVATTSQVGTDYHVARNPISPRQLASILLATNLSGNKHVGIVFGREGEGLHNDEIAQCDLVVTIPSSKEYGTLNLSHAVAVVLYELFQARVGQESERSHNKSVKDKEFQKTTTSHIVYAAKSERDRILFMLDDALDNMGFANELKKNTQRIIWKHLLAKACLTKREAQGLMGFLRKLQNRENCKSCNCMV